MSTIIASTIQDRATNKTLGAERIIDGSVKCFCRYDTFTTFGAKDSLNISSLTDYAVGVTFFNLTSPMANTFYGLVGNHVRRTSWTNTGNDQYYRDGTSYRMQMMEAGTATDATIADNIAVGDLA